MATRPGDFRGAVDRTATDSLSGSVIPSIYSLAGCRRTASEILFGGENTTTSGGGYTLWPGIRAGDAMPSEANQHPWRCDKTYVKVKGRSCYLHRTIDSTRATISFLLSAKPDA
jgi:hypothetical protein